MAQLGKARTAEQGHSGRDTNETEVDGQDDI